jgi:hypothetical protein
MSRQNLIAGHYRAGFSMAKLFELLRDGQQRLLNETLGLLTVGKPWDRLERLKRRGRNPKAGQLYRWDIIINRDQNTVQMINLQPL